MKHDFKREAFSQYGKVFRSKEGSITVEMVSSKEKNTDDLNDAIIKVTGPEAEQENIDGKVIYYRAEPAGTGFNLMYQEGEKWSNRFGSRASWWNYTSFDFYMDNKNVCLYYDEELTKKLNAQHLLTEYEKQNK